ncbi:MAG: 5-dehydro-2-deoxygluconokinase [Bryobacteraceae bacterium]|nr:5-dehydro-2-deoxygluconokinase [Bryobacteraceae bacterium]
MAEKPYDLICVGRSCLDLYSNDIGAPFPEIKTFSAYVGGSPTNICVGARRLGVDCAMLTAVGRDPVGEFVLRFLRDEGIETRFVSYKPGRRTGAAVVGIEPPDRFPLVYYRDNCADIELSIDDAAAAPIDSCRALLIAGTNFSRDPSRSATLFAAERAKAAGAEVFLVLDLRADQWPDLRAYGVTIRSALRLVDVVVGTGDEVKAAALAGDVAAAVEHFQVSDARVAGDVALAAGQILAAGVKTLVMTRGREGVTVYTREGEAIDAAPFPVEVYNTIGAGDAFTAGLLYGRLAGWDWRRAARLGNACGAIVVTRHGCANFMPYLDEALPFIESRGGF